VPAPRERCERTLRLASLRSSQRSITGTRRAARVSPAQRAGGPPTWLTAGSTLGSPRASRRINTRNERSEEAFPGCGAGSPAAASVRSAASCCIHLEGFDVVAHTEGTYTHRSLPDRVARRADATDAAGPAGTPRAAGRTDARADPAWRLRAVPGEQRSAVLRPARPGRSGKEVHQRQEHDSLPHAERRRARRSCMAGTGRTGRTTICCPTTCASGSIRKRSSSAAGTRFASAC